MGCVWWPCGANLQPGLSAELQLCGLRSLRLHHLSTVESPQAELGLVCFLFRKSEILAPGNHEPESGSHHGLLLWHRPGLGYTHRQGREEKIHG